MAIHISHKGDGVYEVTVESASTTSHMVRVDADYAVSLSGGAVSVETLLEKSFEFLLERESNTSILKRFELPVIQRYFPEYEREIRARLG